MPKFGCVVKFDLVVLFIYWLIRSYVKYSVLWFSIYLVLWIWSTDPAQFFCPCLARIGVEKSVSFFLSICVFCCLKQFFKMLLYPSGHPSKEGVKVEIEYWNCTLANSLQQDQCLQTKNFCCWKQHQSYSVFTKLKSKWTHSFCVSHVKGQKTGK